MGQNAMWGSGVQQNIHRVCDGLPPAGVLKGSSVVGGRLAACSAISVQWGHQRRVCGQLEPFHRERPSATTSNLRLSSTLCSVRSISQTCTLRSCFAANLFGLLPREPTLPQPWPQNISVAKRVMETATPAGARGQREGKAETTPEQYPEPPEGRMCCVCKLAEQHKALRRKDLA